MESTVRACPLCGRYSRGATGFPYATTFLGKRFDYVRCDDCASVFVNPVPDAATFQAMYAKTGYHDQHYEGKAMDAYLESARLLRRHVGAEALVLDYGCGTGAFLEALAATGLTPFGVEFDEDASREAARRAGCTVLSVSEFVAQQHRAKFAAIHLADVIEHVPDPLQTLNQLIDALAPGGVLFVEGPIEDNPSPVSWTAHAYGRLKRALRHDAVAGGKPTHLFRTDARQQRAFFKRLSVRVREEHWEVYETGWPYAQGGTVKRAVARLALAVGGAKIGPWTLGNRFRVILRCGGGTERG